MTRAFGTASVFLSHNYGRQSPFTDFHEIRNQLFGTYEEDLKMTAVLRVFFAVKVKCFDRFS